MMRGTPQSFMMLFIALLLGRCMVLTEQLSIEVLFGSIVEFNVDEPQRIPTSIQTKPDYHLHHARFPRDCWLNPPWGDDSLSNERNASRRICAVRGGASAERNLVAPFTTARTLTCHQMSSYSTVPNRTDTTQTTNNTALVKRDREADDRIAIVLLYYSNPRELLLHLEHLSSYSSGLQDQISILWIIDDGSPRGLQAKEYLPLAMQTMKQNLSFPIRVARVTENIPWNMPGTQNLGFYLVPDQSRVLLLDLDTLIPTDVFERLVQLKKSPDNKNSTNDKHQDHVAYRFFHHDDVLHPKIAFMQKETYWHVGGYEEDFVPHYGHTDYAFWYRFRLCGESCQMDDKNKGLFIQEVPQKKGKKKNSTVTVRLGDDGPCDYEDWLFLDGNMENATHIKTQCLNALRSLPKPPKRDDIPRNKKLFQRKKFTQCWSNHYLRFPWVEDEF